MSLRAKQLGAVIFLVSCGSLISADEAAQQRSTAEKDGAAAEAIAIEFLAREVPAWSKNNGCFSCHNNGDAARALYRATRKGYRFSDSVLTETTAWVKDPKRWDQNKGDPGFSDKRLATIQFSASLLEATRAGFVDDRRSLQQAAERLAADQAGDGSWQIDQGNTLGSPATYGSALATLMALETLRKAGEPSGAISKAEIWLRRASPNTVLTAATLLLATAYDTSKAAQLRQEECLKLIRSAQSGDGGWGPYADSPPEVFDTAVVLLALAESRKKHQVEQEIRRGRGFLVAQQNRDGSWPATTRPSGGDSYAQLISTTGWATLALLETR
jgi:hypothetical protein